MSDTELLSIKGLRVAFPGESGDVYPVDGIDLELAAGQILGVVGESGCGKSLTALAVLRLVPSPPGWIAAGSIRYRGRELLELDDAAMRRVRGAEIGMIFQEPMTSLNPVYTCGEQIAEVLRLHEGMGRGAARTRSIELLEQVRIPDPSRRADEYPHQLSGGMRQRVMIAMAIACRPGLLLADEPTTALDVTIQRQILEVLDELRERLGMGIVHITHDLGVIAEGADRVAVMYAGKVVESAPTAVLFERPCHPYTLGLLASRPELFARRKRLPSIPGQVPDPGHRAVGCSFASRCPFAVERCRSEEPPAIQVTEDHMAACFEFERVGAAGRWPIHDEL